MVLHEVIDQLVVTAAASYVDVLLTRISDANRTKRRRVARDLHDHTSHGIGAAMQGVDLALHLLATGQMLDVARLRATRQVLLDTLNDVRGMATRLRDVVERSLGQALREYLDFTAPVGLEVRLVEEGEAARPLPPHVKEEGYLIVREAIRNSLVHGAGATRLDVAVVVAGGRLVATVSDDGPGYLAAVDTTRTVGLASQRERAEGLGGTVALDAGPGGVRMVLHPAAEPGGGVTGGQPPLRLVLVDDHRLFRESLGALLGVHEGIEVVAEGSNGDEACWLARQHRPDVLLLDVEMPGQSVLTSLVEIRSASPSTRIVVLTMHENTTLARQLLLRGASAYLIKTIGHNELVAAVRATTERAADMVTLSVSRGGLAGLAAAGGPVLSDRELEVLSLVSRARTNAAIAAELRITEGTVKRHLSNINAKLGSTSLDAVRRATRARLLSPGLLDERRLGAGPAHRRRPPGRAPRR